MHMLVGDRIKKVRQMTRGEWEDEGWCAGTVVIEMESGFKLYASRDEEGNGPGELFAVRGTTHLWIKP